MSMEALPVEVIRHILKMTLPSREEAMRLGRISLLDTPWSLTFVSSLWRAIALDIPGLWSSITIIIPLSSAPWTNYPARLLELQISRSGVHPLQVIFISDETPGWTTAKLFTTLVESCDRWETLELRSSEWPLESLPRLRERLPLLREMLLYSISPGRNSPLHMADIFQSMPQLRVARFRDLRVFSFALPGARDYINVPWAQLTKFEGMYADELRLAVNLVECKVEVATTSQEPKFFAHLKTLTLLHAQSDFLGSLLLPALEDFLTDIYCDQFEHVIAFLEQSACSLRKFRMFSHPPIDQFLRVLMCNPHIVEIGIVGGEVLQGQRINDVVAALTLRPQQPVYAPELTRFLIHDHRRVLDLDAVLDMLDSRQDLFHLHGCARLESFSLIVARPQVFRGIFRARIAALRAAGLEIELVAGDQTYLSLES
ncbi:hypothetical protein DFH07DRAFT_940035 [Mycena maculata]|uniref:F-box domain-containing protein n=1 Tax=Mycena maculata TaxID=230809 RepID=A0AAD7JC67_9AGAR|nr:hypothetical protein DFH07DRAFT_940035 [Mycena maculata]